MAGGPELPAVDVLAGVAALAEQSLVRRLDAATGEPRFGMLETVREFALEQLTASGDEAEVRVRHAAWCLKVAEQTEAAAWGPKQRAAFDRLQADYDNVRAALSWSLEQQVAIELGLRLAAAMAVFWTVRGPLGEARTWLDRALAIVASDLTPPECRARIHYATGIVAFRQWNLARAEPLLRESVALWQTVGNERGLAEAMFYHAMTVRDAEWSTREQEEFALGVFRRWPPTGSLCPYEHCLGGACSAGRRPAIPLLEEAHAELRGQGDPWGAGASFDRLAEFERERGEVAPAGGLRAGGAEHLLGARGQGGAVECLACLTGGATALGVHDRRHRLIGAADSFRDVLGIALGPRSSQSVGRSVVPRVS